MNDLVRFEIRISTSRMVWQNVKVQPLGAVVDAVPSVTRLMLERMSAEMVETCTPEEMKSKEGSQAVLNEGRLSISPVRFYMPYVREGETKEELNAFLSAWFENEFAAVQTIMMPATHSDRWRVGLIPWGADIFALCASIKAAIMAWEVRE